LRPVDVTLPMVANMSPMYFLPIPFGIVCS
jgi:hypothetical protein